MKKVKLTMTTEDGIVLSEWTIGEELEDWYDIDDAEDDEMPECDFYVRGGWNDDAGVGAEILNEAEIYFGQEF